ncbi:protein phosphatase 1, regulatory (inhibitor) subunit 1B isoform 1 [Silurus asotus]|uniref:Protein phosphatase 1, regulatory (Inhibitor) subunit 1B isoform 1 n=1 Tax=Silurus asotus TaxID=30991 RepID=A0AAD5A024_SILAS|nr:protein phosphatase 1, regulatory (inhibitor) subunit 1B isoform 1 [Silurus asotus]
MVQDVCEFGIYFFKAVQQMAEAHMQKLGVYPHKEEDGEEEERVLRCTADSQTESSQDQSKPLTTDRTEEEEEEEEEQEEEEDEEKVEEEKTAVEGEHGVTDG